MNQFENRLFGFGCMNKRCLQRTVKKLTQERQKTRKTVSYNFIRGIQILCNLENRNLTGVSKTF